MRTTALSLGLIASILVLASGARAEPARTVTVSVRVEPGLVAQLWPAVDADPGADGLYSCDATCTFHVPGGRYRVAVARDGKLLSTKKLEVSWPLSLHVEEPNPSGKWGGLALGIAGLALIDVGFTIVILTNLADGPETDREQTTRTIGWTIVGAGLIATPVGWTLFGQNVSWLRKEEDREVRSFGLSNVSAFVVPMSGGVAGGLSLRF
jgi:hypothetical protein